MAIEDYDPDDCTLDKEPPPAGLPVVAHELWRVASAALPQSGTVGMVAILVRMALRLEAKNQLLAMENRRMKDVVG